MNKSQCYFYYGGDGYRAWTAVKAIESRFLAHQDNLTNLVRYDLSEVGLETLERELITVPFLVSYRLFILRQVFALPKFGQEKLVGLLSQAAPSTIVIIYETKNVDKRTSLYKWLTHNAKSQEFTIPETEKLEKMAQTMAKNRGVTFAPRVVHSISLVCQENTWKLWQETNKLASYVLSQQRTTITENDIMELCQISEEATAFQLTDALRDSELSRAVELYRSLCNREDPLMIAGAIAGQLRAFVKIYLCLQKNIQTSQEIAHRAALSPYVVKLALSRVRQVSLVGLKRAYATVAYFDKSIKDGSVPSDLGVLLIIIRLSYCFSSVKGGIMDSRHQGMVK